MGVAIAAVVFLGSAPPAWAGQATVGPEGAVAPLDRPAATALRLSERAVLGRFTAEVRKNPRLRDRALALWRTHFEAEAAELERRFSTVSDWRPVLAQAAALIDEFLEASLLPREGILKEEDGQGWVEFLDPATGQRARKKVPLRPRPRILAPANDQNERKTERQADESAPATDRPDGTRGPGGSRRPTR